MKTETDYRALLEEKFRQWRSVMEELEVQAALGKAEVKEAIEREKKAATDFIQEQKARMRAEDRHAMNHVHDLKNLLQNLYILLDVPPVKNEEEFEKAKKEMMQAIHQLEDRMKENYREYLSWMGGNLEKLKARLDDFRLKLALSNFDTAAKAEAFRGALLDSLRDALDDVNKVVFPDEDKISRFTEEISKSFDHLKKAFSTFTEK